MLPSRHVHVIKLAIGLFATYLILQLIQFVNIRVLNQGDRNANGIVDNIGVVHQQSPMIMMPMNDPEAVESLVKQNLKRDLDTQLYKHKFLQEINTERLDRLFDKMLKKEAIFEKIMTELDLLSFKKLIESDKRAVGAAVAPQFRNSTLPSNDRHAMDAHWFLSSKDQKIQAKQSFVQYLYEISTEHTFVKPRTNPVKDKIDESTVEPVIITAANQAYYGPMQATVELIHKYLPNLRLIVYDLGLEDYAHKTTVENCKCEVRKFNFSFYSKHGPDHVKNLKNFAWKPIIVQESIRDFGSVIYIDSSIRFKSGDLKPLFSVLPRTGMLTQFIGLKLTSYTDPKMFDWFGETADSYKGFFTIEANIFMFHDTFLTALMIKAWVTCALDINCIAPAGSSLANHRYDQDAMTVVASFFWGHPIDNKQYLPGYSFTTQESYFFDIRRYEGRDYFTQKKSK